MAKVKITLEGNETDLDAQHALQKAFEVHTSGDAHIEQIFDDPAMLDVATKMEEMHVEAYETMLKEIMQLLDEEYAHGN